jgi:hypothetical protein
MAMAAPAVPARYMNMIRYFAAFDRRLIVIYQNFRGAPSASIIPMMVATLIASAP